MQDNFESILCYPAGKTDTKYTLPYGLVSIGNYAFSDCIYLETINIRKIESIGKCAFFGCIQLSSITFTGKNQPAIDNSVFENCKNLKEIIVPLDYVGNHFSDYNVVKKEINEPESNQPGIESSSQIVAPPDEKTDDIAI